MNTPLNCFGSAALKNLEIAEVPMVSVPCIAAFATNVGPFSDPLMITRGMAIGKPAELREISRNPYPFDPPSTEHDPISTFKPNHNRAGEVEKPLTNITTSFRSTLADQYPIVLLIGLAKLMVVFFVVGGWFRFGS